MQVQWLDQDEKSKLFLHRSYIKIRMLDGKRERDVTVFCTKFKELEKNIREKIRVKRDASAPELVQHD